MAILNREQKKNILFSRWAFVVFIIVLIVVARATWSVSKKQEETRQNLTQAEIELHNLREREVSLEEKIAELSTDRGVESEIREKFSVARAGEHAVILVSDEKEKSIPVVAQPELTFFEKIIAVFR